MRDSIPGPWGHPLSQRQMLNGRAPQEPLSCFFQAQLLNSLFLSAESQAPRRGSAGLRAVQWEHSSAAALVLLGPRSEAF